MKSHLWIYRDKGLGALCGTKSKNPKLVGVMVSVNCDNCWRVWGKKFPTYLKIRRQD